MADATNIVDLNNDDVDVEVSTEDKDKLDDDDDLDEISIGDDSPPELQPQLSEEGKKEIEIELLNLEDSPSEIELLNLEDSLSTDAVAVSVETPSNDHLIDEVYKIQQADPAPMIEDKEVEVGTEMIEFGDDSSSSNAVLLEAPTVIGEIDRDVPHDSPPQISEERRIELENELFTLEDDIATLKQVLLRKENQLYDYKVELGQTRWSRIQNSEALKQSKQALSEASVKTGQALRYVGQATANKWTELKQSEKIQTMTGKFWSATGAMKNEINCKLGWGGGGGSTSKSLTENPPSGNSYSPSVGEQAFNNMGMMMCAQVNTISDESDNEEKVVVQ